MSPFAAFGLLLIKLAICAALAGMVTAWTWASGRIWARQPLLPAKKSRVVPWGVGSVLAVIVVWAVVNIVVSVAYLTWTGSLGAKRKPTLTEQMTVVSLVNGALLAVIPITLRLTARAPLSAFGLEPREVGRQALVGTVGFLLATPVVYMVNFLCIKIWEQHKHKLEEMVMTKPNVGVACLAFVSAVVLAPAAEELLFRGVIQSWLAQLWRPGNGRQDAMNDPAAVRSRTTAPQSPDEFHATAVPENVIAVAVEGELAPGRWTARGCEPGSAQAEPSFADESEDRADMVPERQSAAPIIITSALFAVVHYSQWPAPIAIFFLSLVLGVLYQRTGSLLASIVMHALFNGFSTLLLYQAVLNGAPDDGKGIPTATCTQAATPRTSVAEPPVLVASPRRR